MRSLRFRVWDSRFNSWALPAKQSIPRLWLGDDGYFVISSLLSVSKETAIIEQCTEVKDINGDFLWEGDIVRPLYRGPEGSTSTNEWMGLPIVTKRAGEPGVIEYVTEGSTIQGAFAIVVRREDLTVVSYQRLDYQRWTDGDSLWFERLGNIHEHQHLLT